jgi:hypothetical protein
MANNNIKIDLHARKDCDGKTFYIAKLKAPMTIDLEKGATFLIFVADRGQEQLQIAPMEREKSDKEE